MTKPKIVSAAGWVVTVGGAFLLLWQAGTWATRNVNTVLAFAQQIVGRLDALEAGVQDIRARVEQIVIWDAEMSQWLTDHLEDCWPGQEDCEFIFVGSRTPTGSTCTIVDAQPKMLVRGREPQPVFFADTFQPIQLTSIPQPISVLIAVPLSIPWGDQKLLVVTFYEECDFAPGLRLERHTPVLMRTISAPPDDVRRGR